MTRKDYELIARVLVKVRPIGLIFFDRIVNSISDELLRDNPNFDRQKFREACYSGGANEQNSKA